TCRWCAALRSPRATPPGRSSSASTTSSCADGLGHHRRTAPEAGAGPGLAGRPCRVPGPVAVDRHGPPALVGVGVHYAGLRARRLQRALGAADGAVLPAVRVPVRAGAVCPCADGVAPRGGDDRAVPGATALVSVRDVVLRVRLRLPQRALAAAGVGGAGAGA